MAVRKYLYVLETKEPSKNSPRKYNDNHVLALTNGIGSVLIAILSMAKNIKQENLTIIAKAI